MKTIQQVEDIPKGFKVNS